MQTTWVALFTLAKWHLYRYATSRRKNKSICIEKIVQPSTSVHAVTIVYSCMFTLTVYHKCITTHKVN